MIIKVTCSQPTTRVQLNYQICHWQLSLPPVIQSRLNTLDPNQSLSLYLCPASVRTFKEHSYCVNSASGDCTARVSDVREPRSTMIISAHEFEILSYDLNKYDDCIIATAFVDKSIKVWDVRSIRAPISVLNGHSYTVKKVKFSPHRQSLMMSCSYDLSLLQYKD